MLTLQHRLRLVNRLGDAPAIAALVDALDHAEDDECSALAGALVERSGAPVLGSLLRRWVDLNDATRAKAVEIARHAPARVVASASAPLAAERLSALELIARLGLIAGLDAAVDNLTHSDPKVSAAAATAVHAITIAHLNATSAERQRQADDQRLDEALALALDGYPKHRQTAVLVATARMLHAPGPALRKWLADRDHPTHLALRGFMKRLPDAQLAPRLLAWLGIDALGPQALEHVARLAVTPHFAAMIRGHAHLLLLPEQGARLRRLDLRRPAAPPSEIVLEMDDDAQAALPAWLLAVPMPDAERLARLADGVSFRSPRARLAVFRALTTFDDPRGDAIIAPFCFDADERLARLAVMHCIRRSTDGLAELLRRLLHSPHRAVRALAAAHTRAADFESIWSHWSGTGPTVEHRLHARLLMRDEPHGFVAEVRARLVDGQRETCLHAMRLAADLHLLPPVELELLALARSTDIRISATAIKTLGHLDSDSARGVVVAGLQHADLRTRANAIEVLAPAFVETNRDTLESIARSPDNRPRANAIAAIARVDRDDAAVKLDRMLTDARPLHRLSALWAADITTMTQCATRVAALARQDVSRPVRDRARRTARRLLAAMTVARQTPKIEWRESEAAPLEPGEAPASSRAASISPTSALSHLLLVPLAPVSLAQSADRLAEISRSFVGRESIFASMDWTWLPPALAASGVIAATLLALRWSINDARRFGPAYRAVANGLKLTRRERWLLHTVAVRCGRTSATGLLLSRGCYDHHVNQWRQSLARPDDPRLETLTALRGRIFG